MRAQERITGEAWPAPWLRHQHVTRYQWAASLAQGARMLDAACANAYGSVALLNGGARLVVGLDIALEAVREGRSTHGRERLALLLGDGTRLPFRDGAFDVFVSFETIEHVDDDHAYLAEARRVVRPDGIFLCSTPNRRLVNAGNTIHDRPFNPHHRREYTHGELAARLAPHFADVQWYGQSDYSRVYAKALAVVGRKWRTAGIRLHQLRKLSTIVFERAAKHRPFPLVATGEPEVLIALCR